MKQDNRSKLEHWMQTDFVHLLFLYNYSLLIKNNQEKFFVKIDIHNSGDNAYNTRVTLSHTENINYVKVEVSHL